MMGAPEPWSDEAREQARVDTVRGYIHKQLEARAPLQEGVLIALSEGDMKPHEAEQLATEHRERLLAIAHAERLAPHLAWRDRERRRHTPWWHRRQAELVSTIFRVK